MRGMSVNAYRLKAVIVALASSLIVGVAPGPEANGQNSFWIDPNGGSFSDPTNWIPGSVPDDTDTVFFQVPGTYDVNLPNDARIQALDIDDGADPVFRAQSTDPTGLTLFTVDSTLVVLDSRLTFETIGDRRLEVDVNGPTDITGFANDDTRSTLMVLDGVTYKADSTNLGTSPGRLGRVVVSGTTALWDMSTRNMTMGTRDGIGGGGELVIEGGGEFIGNGLILGQTLPNANNSNRTSVHVTGVGADGQPSTLNVDTFDIATSGLGQLRIDGGARVVAEGSNVGTQFATGFGILEVLGTDAAGNPSLWQTGGFLINDLQGPTGFMIAGGARVESEQVLVEQTSAPIVIEGIAADGSPSTWKIDALATLGRRQVTEIEVRDGARVETQNVLIGVTPQSNTQIRLLNSDPGANPTTTWFSSGDVQVGFQGGSGTGFGEIDIPSGTELGVGGRLTIAPASLVTLDGGTLFLGEYDPEDSNGGGELRLNAGKLEIERILGDFTLEGVTLSPADDLGVAGILGNYEQEATGTLLFELGGSTAGVDFDQLTVTGFADLGGELAVELTDGFTPSANDTFTIFDAAILAGIFDNVLPGQRLTTADGRGTFQVDYGLGSPAPTGQIVLSDFLAIAGLTGDYNGDGFVSQSDLDLVLLNWGDSAVPSGFILNNLPGSGPFDGLISQNELDGVLLNWGNGTAPLLAVPEPATLGMVAGFVLLGLTRRVSVRRCDAAVVGVLILSVGVHAQDIHDWNEPAGGSYGTTTNWDPVGLPSSFDTARFDLNTDYTVSFLQDRTVRQIQVLGGDIDFQGTGTLPGEPRYTAEILSLTAGDLLLKRGGSDRGLTFEVTNSTNIRGGLFVTDGTRLVTDSTILDRTGSGIGGRVYVQGTGPGGETSGWSAGQVFVGNVGRGEVRVEDGAYIEVDSNMVLGSSVGSIGELTVTGVGPFAGSDFATNRAPNPGHSPPCQDRRSG